MNSVNDSSAAKAAPRYAHEDPLKGRFRPWIALDAIRRLIRDKEDTTQVFRILQSVRGYSFENMFARFKTLPVGQRVIAQKEELIDIACDHDYLRSLPADSFGRAYYNFMQNCGITPQGLLAAKTDAGVREDILPEDFRRFSDRTRVQHDMWHIVSGYGCEGLGEVCVVALSYPQTRNLGFSVIAVAGAFNYAKYYPGEPIWKAMFEGYKRGKRAAWLPGVDWAAMMPLPLAQVRDQLGLGDTPTHYMAAQTCRSESMQESPIPKAA
jgi:ubiquinone biosynthesis protein COQ4